MPVITKMNDIQLFRLKILASALKLETLGMKRRGQSVYSIVKVEFGFKGDKLKVLSQLNELIKTESMKEV